MEHEYEVTLEDLVAFNLHYFQHNPAMRRQLLRARILVSFLTPLLTLLTIAAINGASRRGRLLDWFAVVVGLSGGAVIYLLYPWLSRRGLRRRVTKLLADPANRNMLGKKQLRLRPDAIELRSEHSTSSTAWAGIEQLGLTESLVLLYLTGISAIVVPKRSFADAAKAQVFEQVVRQHYQAATGKILQES